MNSLLDGGGIGDDGVAGRGVAHLVGAQYGFEVHGMACGLDVLGVEPAQHVEVLQDVGHLLSHDPELFLGHADPGERCDVAHFV